MDGLFEIQTSDFPRLSSFSALARMFNSLLPLLFASIAVAGVLPSDRRDIFNDTSFHTLYDRGIFGPIGTGSAAGIAGGQVVSGSPPVSSFFAGLRPPVRELPFVDRNMRCILNADIL
jgi:hypothetical protein